MILGNFKIFSLGIFWEYTLLVFKLLLAPEVSDDQLKI